MSGYIRYVNTTNLILTRTQILLYVIGGIKELLQKRREQQWHNNSKMLIEKQKLKLLLGTKYDVLQWAKK